MPWTLLQAEPKEILVSAVQVLPESASGGGVRFDHLVLSDQVGCRARATDTQVQAVWAAPVTGWSACTLLDSCRTGTVLQATGLQENTGDLQW
jgi:hypothetical protein